MSSPEKRLKRSAPEEEEGKQPEITLWTYFRSSCSWRVRIALALKDLKYQSKPINLIKDGGEQLKDDFAQDVNPSKAVPAMQVDGDEIIAQSMAILEYLEERFPDGPSLFPKDLGQRAKARQIAMIIAADTQPLQNLRVLGEIKAKLNEEEKLAWAQKWIEAGLRAAEAEVAKFGGQFCVGNQPSVADLCLIPQLYNARRFNINLEQFPKLLGVEKHCVEHPAFQAAHPRAQPDCPAGIEHPC